jgi:long-chain fatty acid transport protein
MRRSLSLRRWAPVLGAAAGLLAASAQAAGLDTPNVGSPTSGPVTRDAAATWHNPALLALLTRPQLMLGVGVALAHIGYTRERRGSYQQPDRLGLNAPVDPGSLDPSQTGTAAAVSSNQILPAGDAFVAVPVGSRVGVGIGLAVPYAAPVEYDPQGPQRFALQSAFIAITQITAAVGVKVHPRVQIGAGADLILGVANLKRIQDFGALNEFGEALNGPPANQPNGFGSDAPSELRELSVLARPLSITDASATNASFHAGIAVQPTDAIELGLTYQHGTDLTFEGDFNLDMSDDFFTQDLSPVGLAYPRLVTGKGRLNFKLPDRQVLAAAMKVAPRTRFEARLSRAGWSSVDAFTIGLNAPGLEQPAFGLARYARNTLPRRWNDTYGLALWGHFGLAGPDPEAPTTTISAGLAYETPASPDETIDASSPDGHRLTLRGVARFTLSPAWSVATHATLQFIVPRTVTDSDYDLGNGTYSLLVAQVGGHFTYAWGDAPPTPSEVQAREREREAQIERQEKYDLETYGPAPTAPDSPEPTSPKPTAPEPASDDGAVWPSLERQ